MRTGPRRDRTAGRGGAPRRPLAPLAATLAALVLLAGCATTLPSPERTASGLAYRVFVPPGAASAALPVVVFLHDYYGDDGILWRQGVIAELAERMRSGRAPRFVVLAPAGDH